MQTSYHPTAAATPRTQQSYDMNRLYLSQSQQQLTRPGVFLNRNERIDWRRIAAIDVDRIARDMDVQALQDNIEHITLCNIDAEIDTRAMDPNFVKLYKMAQLTIQYLMTCQDQITTQLTDYEQSKNEVLHEQTEARHQIKILNDELVEAKKELKKRRKMLETQQRMLMAQNSNYHTCPVCTHAFLSVAYLQAHMKRRHPDYEPIRRREHDVDVEKEIQRLKDELNKKDTEVQVMKAEKKAAEEKIRDLNSTINELKEEVQSLTTKLTILDDRISQLRTNTRTRSPSPRQHGTDFSEMSQENKNLRADIKQLKQELQAADINLKKEEKLRRQIERENEKHLKEIAGLMENLQLLQTTPGDAGRLSKELITVQNQYNQEKLRSKTLEEQLHDAINELAQYRKQPPPVIDRVRPADPPIDTPTSTRPIRPIQTANILLPEYCQSLVERLKHNPKHLTKYRDEAKRQYVEELEELENLGISETDTRLTDLDFRTKMESVLQTRRNIQKDLPEFERIRANLIQILDKRVNERLDLRQSITSIRSTGSKLVTFQDEHYQPKYPSSISQSTKKHSPDRQDLSTKIQTKSKHDHSRPTAKDDFDDDVTISNASESDEDTQPTRPDIHPPPRRNIPQPKTTSGISALVTAGIRPSPTNEGSAISAIARQPLAKPTSTVNKWQSDSERESPIPPTSTVGSHAPTVAEKKRIIEQKLHESSIKGEKPSVDAIAQGFAPSKASLAAQHRDDDGDDGSESFTTLHTNPPLKQANGHLPQLSGRDLVNNNLLSSGDMSHTYDSLWKSQANKGTDLRRPLTADSAKTSDMDSDENVDGEESN